MAGLAGMHEKGRRARRGERGGDLLADMAALAHAGDDDAPARGVNSVHRARKGGPEPVIDRRLQHLQAADLKLKRAARRGDRISLAAALGRFSHIVHVRRFRFEAFRCPPKSVPRGASAPLSRP